MPRAPRLILLLLLLATLPRAASAAETASAPATGGVLAARRALRTGYAAELKKFAEELKQSENLQAAAEVEDWLPKFEPDRLTLFLIPAASMPGDEAAAKSAAQDEWRQRWLALRERQADSLFALARQALTEHAPSLAYELVTEAVRENPDHKLGRRMLGYVRHRDQWRTPFEIRQLGAGKVWHDKFGWLPKSHVERYENGQRYFQGRWMAAEDDTALRTDPKRGWRIESEHYLVSTNHSLEEGVALSKRLEVLYDAWQQVFAPYVMSETELNRRLEGRGQRREARQHNVVYFRTREQYITALRPSQPKIDITLGIYFANVRTAYFFAGQDQDPGTLFHEATHQLFQESRPVSVDVGQERNFWIVEGVACYMQTLAEHTGYCQLGGMNTGRMPAARHRLLKENFYVPLAELVRIGSETLQQNPKISIMYGQCAALTDFLMHDADSRYREALVRYLDAVYAGRDNDLTLADITSKSYETLDGQFRKFMSQAPVETPGDSPPSSVDGNQESPAVGAPQ